MFGKPHVAPRSTTAIVLQTYRFPQETRNPPPRIIEIIAANITRPYHRVLTYAYVWLFSLRG